MILSHAAAKNTEPPANLLTQFKQCQQQAVQQRMRFDAQTNEARLYAQIVKLCQHFLDDRDSLVKQQGLTQERVEQIFARGISAYQDQHYQAALPDFATVLSLAPLEQRHQMAMASTLQQLQRYNDALIYYAIACLLDADDPVPSYRIAQCQLALDKHADAHAALHNCLEQCGEQARFRELSQQAHQMLASLG